MDNTTTTTLLQQQQQQQSFFHTDGYILLPSLLSPSFISQLHTECLDIFTSVLDWLTLVGAADFNESCRLRREASNSSSGISELLEEYEYPIKLGIKNGYQELVMRSPGRYELALLILEEEISAATNHSRKANTEIMTNNSITEEEACYYNDKRLMTVEMIEQAKRQFLATNNGDDTSGGHDEKRSVKNIETASTEAPTSSRRRKSCLRQLLGWIKQYENKSNFNDDAGTKENDVQHDNDNSSDDNLMHQSTQNDEHTEASEEESINDEMNFKAFMELVSAIFSPSATTTCGSNDNHKDKTTVTDDEYYLCNLSLLISTPGSPTQSWHADGGHTSLTIHHPCHVFNVFIPLVDVPLSMGPTELRPGSHVYTRDLTRLMLLAKAKKLLRETVVAEMGRGDALVFDYRILHRGRANMSDRVVMGENDGDTNGERNAAEDDVEEQQVVEESSRRDDGGNSGTNKASNKCRGSGRDRPVLVLTFARSWFVDVCNFPKRSIFSLQEKNESSIIIDDS